MAASLKKQIIHGIGWRGGTDVLQQILQIVFTAILARLLTKADFGLVAMALLITRFVRTVTQIGFGTAIIQSQEVTKGQISAIFYFQLILNLILSTIVYFGAGLTAGFFEEPQLIPLVKVLAWIIFLQTFQFPNILLRKKMDFKRFSIMEMGSMLLANGVAITMAFTGYGVWALVWRILIQRFSFGLFSWILTKWKPTKPEFSGIGSLIKFGMNMLGAHALYFFAENLVAILTGKFLGKETLGLFNIAYNLAIIPASKIQKILTSVLTPGFAKIQYNIESFRKNYTKALMTVSIFFIPFMLIMAGTATNLIPAIYGEKWAGAGNLLLILSFVGLFRGLAHLLRSAIIAKGKSNIIFYFTIIEIAFSIPIMYLTLNKWGIHGLIFGYLIGALAGLSFLIYHYDSAMKRKWSFLKAIYNELIIALGIFFVTYFISFLNFEIYVELTLQLVIGFLLFLGSLYFIKNLTLLKVKAIIKNNK